MFISHSKIRSYIVGFILCLLLTTLSFALVAKHIETHHTFPAHPTILYFVIGLALVQFIVQLIFFLHLNFRQAERWNLFIFVSTMSLVFIIIGGSLWIMYHLNYNMTPTEMDAHNIQEEGIRHQ